MVAFGPGTLKIGTAGSETDYSCLVTSLELTVSATPGESTFKLCGTETPGATEITGELAGVLDQDIDQAGGLFEFASRNSATVQSFIFEPNSSAGLAASGMIQLMPLSFGGDEYGAELTSDVTWPTVGNITYTRDGGASWVQPMGKVAATTAPPATGATAGAPGAYTPAGAAPPADVPALIAGTPNAVVASPTTAWTTGQYVQTRTGGAAGQAHWNGTAWTAGQAV